ncbi:MAG: hypothetical protein ACFFAO_05065, partial [Candidatus Hermodarchaeota archaeon]
MTPKKYLSNKKTTQQTISISPALKDWIIRYVNIMHKKKPNDETYKSLSSFYCKVMENVLTIFEKGKTLEDFDRLVDSEINNMYKNTIISFGPYAEAAQILGAFAPIDSIINSKFFFKTTHFSFRNMDVNNIKSLEDNFERIRKYYLNSKLPKNITIQIFMNESKKGYHGIIEHTSVYKYLQFANVKITVALFGFIGIKIVDIYYTEEFDAYYFKIKFETTDLFLNNKNVDKTRTQRLNLARKNVNYIINFNRVVDYESPHLWQRLAVDNDNIIKIGRA